MSITRYGWRNTPDLSISGGSRSDVPSQSEDAPSAGWTILAGLNGAIGRARSAAGEKDFQMMGRAEMVRQELRVGYVEERSSSIGIVELDVDERPLESSEESVDLEHISQTHVTDRSRIRPRPLWSDPGDVG